MKDFTWKPVTTTWPNHAERHGDNHEEFMNRALSTKKKMM